MVNIVLYNRVTHYGLNVRYLYIKAIIQNVKFKINVNIKQLMTMICSKLVKFSNIGTYLKYYIYIIYYRYVYIKLNLAHKN